MGRLDWLSLVIESKLVLGSEAGFIYSTQSTIQRSDASVTREDQELIETVMTEDIGASAMMTRSNKIESVMLISTLLCTTMTRLQERNVPAATNAMIQLPAASRDDHEPRDVRRSCSLSAWPEVAVG